MDKEEWLDSMRDILVKRTGRNDIEVTGGPYRSYDVRVSHVDCHPVVDFYTAMRWDPKRVSNALNYAVSMIRDWEATLASQEKERELVLPHFERLQRIFPDYELHYTVEDRETHFVQVEKRKDKIIVSFDLWPAMKERNIQRLADYIKSLTQEVAERTTDTIDGIEYW